MKTLLELQNDEANCQSLFDFLFNKGKVENISDTENDSFEITGSFYWDISRIVTGKIIIWDDGDMFLYENGAETSISNPFALSDFIRSLGYEPT